MSFLNPRFRTAPPPGAGPRQGFGRAEPPLTARHAAPGARVAPAAPAPPPSPFRAQVRTGTPPAGEAGATRGASPFAPARMPATAPAAAPPEPAPDPAPAWTAAQIAAQIRARMQGPNAARMAERPAAGAGFQPARAAPRPEAPAFAAPPPMAFGARQREPDPAPQPTPQPMPQPAAQPARRAARAFRRDPAPSRLSYRMHRLWLTPLYRALFRVGLPAFGLAFAAGIYLSDDARREALAGQGAALVRAVQERPEFMVGLMAVEGASPELGAAIRAVLPVDFPVSSFDLDLAAMREAVTALDAVASADLRIRPGGVLTVRVVERTPAILWRDAEGLVLLDATGNRVARVASRLERPDLTVIAGDGADAAVPEALRLIEAAAPVAGRFRGLVRMGERRWDLVLDNGQRILLPETGALAALERVMALTVSEDLLARDVTVVDMRYGARPTLRLSPRALEALRNPSTETGASNG